MDSKSSYPIESPYPRPRNSSSLQKVLLILAALASAAVVFLYLINPFRHLPDLTAFNPLHLFGSADYDTQIASQGYSIANSTLGFEKFFYINNPIRSDLDDVVVLQSLVSEVAPQRFAGVNPSDISDKSLPPSSRNSRNNHQQLLSEHDKAVFRSHANLWRDMIKNNWQTMLVIGADATWDIDIRQIMAHYSHGLDTLIHQRPKPNKNASTKDDFSARLLKNNHVSSNDPYLHQNWDILQLGGCNPKFSSLDDSVEYYDPHSPASSTLLAGRRIKQSHRLVTYRGQERCSTAYAVTLQGAIKLLTRYSYDMSGSLDNVIHEMVQENLLHSYTVYPVPFIKWAYVPKIVSSGENPTSSELRQQLLEKGISESEFLSQWKSVMSDMIFWKYSPVYKDSWPKNGSLKNLKGYFYDNVSEGLDFMKMLNPRERV